MHPNPLYRSDDNAADAALVGQIGFGIHFLPDAHHVIKFLHRLQFLSQRRIALQKSIDAIHERHVVVGIADDFGGQDFGQFFTDNGFNGCLGVHLFGSYR